MTRAPLSMTNLVLLILALLLQAVQGLIIHDWLDSNYFQFTYEANSSFTINLSSSDVDSDVDIALYDDNGFWSDSSLSLDSSEQISMAGLSSGTNT